MTESPTPSGYRSSRISPAPGTTVLPPAPASSKTRRLWNIAADVAALPLVVALPRQRIELLDERVPLHYELRRWAWRTERCVEIALGNRAINAHSPEDVLEVGNVMPMAGVTGHAVVDKYEAGAGVINQDIVGFVPDRSYELVLSLSTLEHVGWDEIPREPEKAARALHHMSGLVADDGALLVTIPVGWHRDLEAEFVRGDGPFDSVMLLVRTGRRARWEVRPVSERTDVEYGSPFPCGNGILVGVRGQPFGCSPAR